MLDLNCKCRNYYRCSIWKGCLARKLVQRSPMDPNIFIVMHVGRHVHPGRRAQGRSSLVGGIQNRFAVATQRTRTPSRRRPVERPVRASRASPATPLAEYVTDDEEIAKEDVAFDDDEDPQLIPNLGSNPNQDIIVLAQELSKNVASPQEWFRAEFRPGRRFLAGPKGLTDQIIDRPARSSRAMPPDDSILRVSDVWIEYIGRFLCKWRWYKFI